MPDIPVLGGTLDFNAEGVAGCVRCGWRGIPTFEKGVRSTWCPACHIPTGAPKIGRNAPCPCGSGRKFKKCCGA